ncbi:hypothetical protein KAI78_08380 [bacterium]|nr:hypothetical protein [bacterium]
MKESNDDKKRKVYFSNNDSLHPQYAEEKLKIEIPDNIGFASDEAVENDLLGFNKYSKILVDLILNSVKNTPFTIGIHGHWGSGKTSLMKQIQNSLKERNTLTVFFEAWQYEKEEEILIPLLQTIDNKYGKNENAEKKIRKKKKATMLFNTIAVLSGDLFLKTMTNGSMGIQDIFKTEKYFKNQYLENKSEFIKIKDKFKKAINKILGNQKNKLLVIFIDDLDRCSPENVIIIFEKIKLFLYVKNCVFVIGVDKRVIEKGLEIKYKEIVTSNEEEEKIIRGEEYLEKFIQVPFNLPTIKLEENLKNYFDGLSKELSVILGKWRLIIAKALKYNPRRIKLFLNTYLLYYRIAEEEIKNGKIKNELLIKCLIIYFRNSALYEKLGERPADLGEIERVLENEK